jgi:hypothetical protein
MDIIVRGTLQTPEIESRSRSDALLCNVVCPCGALPAQQRCPHLHDRTTAPPSSPPSPLPGVLPNLAPWSFQLPKRSPAPDQFWQCTLRNSGGTIIAFRFTSSGRELTGSSRQRCHSWWMDIGLHTGIIPGWFSRVSYQGTNQVGSFCVGFPTNPTGRGVGAVG